MKHLIAIILLSVVCAIPACAQDDDKPKAQWEVKIDITYNAVSRQEAEKIASRFMSENGTACKAETRIKKVDTLTGDVLTSSFGDYDGVRVKCSTSQLEVVNSCDGEVVHIGGGVYCCKN